MRTLWAVVIISGCAAQHSTPGKPTCPQPAKTCVELSAELIGQLPLELDVGTRRISVAEWTTADERSSSVVGFAAYVPHDVTFTVHAGPDAFAGQGARWLNPNGVVGRSVHGIDGITFCQSVVARCERPAHPAVAMK